ncbi:YeeE/YedE family protein [Rhizobium sp.]|uniref:YeeE/YedE family protein n=1 Tax=Rhizobium sp. TaxID=391 RepID=UPI002F04D5B4
MTPYLFPFVGGMLLGLSAVLLLLLNGRIAGISGILGRLLGGHSMAPNAAFIAGLLAGPFLYAAAFGQMPAMTVSASWLIVLLAGLLVGIGTRLGSGCTSGHGILGLARFSKRSFAAMAVFLATGIVTATAMGILK